MKLLTSRERAIDNFIGLALIFGPEIFPTRNLSLSFDQVDSPISNLIVQSDVIGSFVIIIFIISLKKISKKYKIFIRWVANNILTYVRYLSSKKVFSYNILGFITK